MNAMGLYKQFLSSAVIWSFLGTGLRMAGLFLILPLTLRIIPSEQLGLWYIFLAFGAMVPMLDAGFGPTSVRMTGYIWAGSDKIVEFGHQVVPDEGRANQPNWSLLAEMVGTMTFFYRCLSIVILVIIGFGGGIWIWHQTQELPQSWFLRGAWILYVVGLSVNIWGSVWTCMLTGINQVKISQQIFVLAVVSNYLVTALGIICGIQIWALVLGQIIYGGIIRILGKKAFLKNIANHIGPARPMNSELLKTMWPMAWRAGLIIVGSFFIVQANTIVCGVRLGLHDTASFGLSMQLISAIVGISTVWIGVKAPIMNQLRTQGKISDLALLFSQRLKISIITYFLGATALLLMGPFFIKLIGSKTELLATPLLGLLLIFMFLEMHHSQYASLVLTENQNPFVVPALLSGLLVVTLSWFLAPKFGLIGIICSFGFVQLSFNNWWTVLRGIRGLGLSFSEYLNRFMRAKIW